jgi:hypothetical protein
MALTSDEMSSDAEQLAFNPRDRVRLLDPHGGWFRKHVTASQERAQLV